MASAVCGAQAVVIRAPSSEGVLTCGGAPMTPLGEAAPGAAELAAAEEGCATAGKRYVDESVGLEVLCAKTGLGAFAYEGRRLTLKEAKRLPASD